MLDALMACTMMAVALLSLAQVLIQTHRATAAAGRTTVATLMAEQKIEDLRVAGPGAAPTAADSPAPGFRRAWSVTPLASDPEHLAIVDVRVRTADGETRLVALLPGNVP